MDLCETLKGVFDLNRVVFKVFKVVFALNTVESEAFIPMFEPNTVESKAIKVELKHLYLCLNQTKFSLKHL